MSARSRGREADESDEPRSTDLRSPPIDDLIAAARNVPDTSNAQWLEALLARNAETAYLRRHGSPRTLEAFRDAVPVASYEDLQPSLARIHEGEPDVRFSRRPIAFERTCGSTGAAKV